MDPTPPLRAAMRRQHARGQVADLVREFGVDFVEYEVQQIKDRERRRLDAEWRQHCAERDAYIATLLATPHPPGG